MAAAAVPRKRSRSPVPAPPKPSRSSATPNATSTTTRVDQPQLRDVGAAAQPGRPMRSPPAARRAARGRPTVPRPSNEADECPGAPSAAPPPMSQAERVTGVVSGRSTEGWAGSRAGGGGIPASRRPWLGPARPESRRGPRLGCRRVASGASVPRTRARRTTPAQVTRRERGLGGLRSWARTPASRAWAGGGVRFGGSGHAGAGGISVSVAWSIGCPQVGQKTALSSTSVPQFAQKRVTAQLRPKRVRLPMSTMRAARKKMIPAGDRSRRSMRRYRRSTSPPARPPRTGRSDPGSTGA